MDKNKVYKIVLTVISFIVLVLSIVGIYFMFEATYSKNNTGVKSVIVSTE